MCIRDSIITSTLMVFMLIIIYNLIHFVNVAYDHNRERSDAVQNTATSLWIYDKYISQNMGIETANGYTFSCFTDVDADNIIERTVFTYNTSAHTISYTVYNTDSNRVNTSVKTTGQIAENVWNANYETPLYTYYNDQGNVITDPEKIASDTRQIKVNILTRGPGSTPKTYSNSRTIYLRNRGL